MREGCDNRDAACCARGRSRPASPDAKQGESVIARSALFAKRRKRATRQSPNAWQGTLSSIPRRDAEDAEEKKEKGLLWVRGWRRCVA
jgi:hypothetical protein